MSGRLTGRSLLLTALPLAAVPCVANAQSHVRVSADASAEIGYSSNPFSLPAGSTDSGFAEVRVMPQVKLVSEHSTIALSVPLDYQRYFSLYGDNFDYGAGLDYRGTPSERVSTHLNVSFDSSVVGQNNRTFGVIDPNLPELPINSGTDISLFGTRDRRDSFRANGDVSVLLSERDSLSASAYYLRSRYRQFSALGDNDGYGGSAGYSRRVSQNLQLGAQGSVSRYDYRGVLGDSMVYSAQGSFSATLGPHWKADGAIGVSFVNRNIGGSSTSLSGNLRLCRDTSRSTFCLLARRAVLPTGISGTQNTTSVGANYSYKTSERGTIIASADYTKNGSDQLASFASNEYLSASLGYQHVLRKRVRLVTSGRYRKIFGGVVERGADYGGQAGISVSLGDGR